MRPHVIDERLRFVIRLLEGEKLQSAPVRAAADLDQDRLVISPERAGVSRREARSATQPLPTPAVGR